MENAIKELLNYKSRKEINYAEKFITDYYVDYLNDNYMNFEVNNSTGKNHIYSESGLLGYKDKTVLEVKLYKLPNGMYKFTEQELLGKTLRIENIIKSKEGLKNIIFVVNSSAYLSITTIETRISDLAEKYSDVNLIFVSLEEFFAKIDSPRDKLEKSLSDLNDIVFNDEINDAVIENKKFQLQRNDKLISELNKKYKSDELVLFIGAGASKDAGMPLWNELLFRYVC